MQEFAKRCPGRRRLTAAFDFTATTAAEERRALAGLAPRAERRETCIRRRRYVDL